MKIKYLLLLLLLASFTFSCSYKDKLTATKLSLAPVYTSNMVFRQGDTLKLSGTCSPGGILGVKLQNGLKYITADPNGYWEVKFPPIDYKGAFNITVEGAEEKIQLKNLITGNVWVVFGDTWLPEKPEFYTDNAEIPSTATNANVRIFNPGVLISGSGQPIGEWRVLDNRSRSYRQNFASLLGYALNEKGNVAIGIINLAYPGTRVNNFSGAYRALAESGVQADTAWMNYFSSYKKAQFLADSSFKGIEREVLERYYDDWEWSDVSMPLITSKRWYLKNKIAWLRKKVYIPEKNLNSDFTMDMGIVRGQFDIYFNGVHIKKFAGETDALKVAIPDTLLKVWTNLITVRMVAGDTLSGMYTSAPGVYNADSSYYRSLSEDWKIRTYYEPTLPVVAKNKLLWPKVYEEYLNLYGGIKANGAVIAGGVNMYLNTNVSAQEEMLKEVSKAFSADENYLYLLPEPGTIDAMVNGEYFNAIRNDQLKAAAKEKWTTINTLDIDSQEKPEILQNKMVTKLIER